MNFMNFKDNCGFGLLASIDNNPTHNNVEDAITALERMMHRGAVAADGKTGDGSGLLFSMPKLFMKKVASKEGIDLPDNFAIAMVFSKNEKDKEIIEQKANENDLKILLFREVPIDKNALGEQAIKSLPNIYQVFLVPNSIIATKRFEELLYLTRKEIESAIDDEDFYIPTMSSKKLSYKGLVMPTHIREFYKDLRDEDFKVSFALFHQRFSTNTLPQWRLAQPFRCIAHNGEINSIQANRINMYIKSEALKSNVFTETELEKLLPIVQMGGSDSASLDNIFEFLTMNGVDFFKSARALIPMPWQNSPHMDSDLRAFYEFTSTCFEACDGPAAVSLTDGRYIGVVLDRNGLRPAKYIITKDNRIVISSEYGVNDIDDNNILERGRLQSGEMIGIDLKFGLVIKNNKINDYLKSSNPYSKWLNENLLYLQEYVEDTYCLENFEIENQTFKERYAGICDETLKMMILPMMKEGKEATGSMGDDTPLACFSDYPFRSFNDFFRQKFAQVTNPPIDPLREKVVMSLNTGFGELHNILDENPNHAKRLKSSSPILTQTKFEVLKSFGDEKSPRYEKYYKNRTYGTIFKDNLKDSLEELVSKISDDVKNDGVRIIILDDSNIDKDNKAIPMAMVIGRLHKKLIDIKVRYLTSIVAVSSEMITAHDAAVMIGFGVTAIYPYMLFKVAFDEAKKDGLDVSESLYELHSSINKGILKIMSKMGIATVASYRNSALFDVIGLSEEMTKECFIGSELLIPGLGYKEIENKLNIRHEEAMKEDKRLKTTIIQYRKGGEIHDNIPAIAKIINKLSISGEKSDYDILKDMVENRKPTFIRDFIEIKSDKESISIDEVESKEEIFKRFVSAAMSIGALSKESHETLAEAMNMIGAKSNSGEGGEDRVRYGTIKESKVKQIASGRFGVTPEYLRNAEELQIKVAQGAKPGEGGQLPGFKVTEYIAKLRNTTPNKTLISPPPHHDIYSIEDLAQLIFDLKQINPKAIVSVKLVSTAGVGTIAAGVAKAYADKIIISGSEGGTGAAPITSIRNAGNPWEIGLIEAQLALKANNLRNVVRLETDGNLKVGRDIIIASLLGAETYAFGTNLLMTLRCIFCRSCHHNTCPVGLTTQDPIYEAKYQGDVERVINYLTLLAEDIRNYLANMGYKSIDDIVGRNDLLITKDIPEAKNFNFSELFTQVDGARRCEKERNEPFDDNKFEKELVKEVMKTIKNPSHKTLIKTDISNLNRSFGTYTSGIVAEYYGDTGLEDDSIIYKLEGVTGQGLGTFLNNGITIEVSGVANDYIGKGMHGGKIVIVPKTQGKNMSVGGNTCLYGATGGKLFIAGSVGERFAVRNSGTIAVVEGVGDHPCEYMTGGEVIVLGKTGVNFGAGMTGGIAFIYDLEHRFVDDINPELIDIKRIDTDENEKEKLYLKKRIVEYYNATGSKKAKFILDNFRSEVRHFWMVTPKDNKIPLDPNDMD